MLPALDEVVSLSFARPDLLLTVDANDRLTTSSSAGSTGYGSTLRYDPPSVPQPTSSEFILWNDYDAADAAYTLRRRVKGAAQAISTATTRQAAAHRRAPTTSDVRKQARRLVAALPASVAPVRWAKVRSGVKVHGWNRFTHHRVIYTVRVAHRHVVVTRTR